MKAILKISIYFFGYTDRVLQCQAIKFNRVYTLKLHVKKIHYND